MWCDDHLRRGPGCAHNAPSGAQVLVLGGVSTGPGEDGGDHEVMRGGISSRPPYTATGLIETTQALVDGNRSVNRSTALLARDNEGRRGEESTDHSAP